MRKAATATSTPHRATSVPGFSLIEVILATALFTVVMILLASMALSAGRRGRLNDLTTKRNLVLSQQGNRISTMPFADVALLADGTTQLLVGDFTFNRRLDVTQETANRYKILVVVEPPGGEFRPDSVTIYRTRPASGTPLCTTC